VRRSVLAAFFAALLRSGATEKLRFRKHGGVHSAFGEHFAKTGLLDAKFHRWLIDAFDLRSTADYGLDVPLTSDDATQTIARAEEFLTAARGLLDAG